MNSTFKRQQRINAQFMNYQLIFTKQWINAQTMNRLLNKLKFQPINDNNELMHESWTLSTYQPTTNYCTVRELYKR